jgi:uncharacterized protein YceH (UPF0502 family)
MEVQLNDIEVRVLGCLIEKEMATPEYYPLTLNALTNACNQKSNRDPVLELAETDVVRALDNMRFAGLAVQTASDGGRVPKYRHLLFEKLGLEPEHLALLCELLVRGPQTTGELRTRASRMHELTDLAQVETLLQELIDREDPLVTLLPRQAGRKEPRYAHLFAGQPQLVAEESAPAPEAARRLVDETDARIARLESEMAALREEFAAFRKQFE